MQSQQNVEIGNQSSPQFHQLWPQGRPRRSCTPSHHQCLYRRTWLMLRPDQQTCMALATNQAISACFVLKQLNEDCQYGLCNKQTPGSHLVSLCTCGIYKPKPPSTNRGLRQHKEATNSITKFGNGHHSIIASAAAVSNPLLLTKDV